MTAADPPPQSGIRLSPADHRDLDIAVDLLENPGPAVRLAIYAGQPVNGAMQHLPGVVNRLLASAVRSAILQCLEIAIGSLDATDQQSRSKWIATVMAGLAGGLGGVFGIAALPIELPLTTTLMLRAIAEIAREQGEDLNSLEAQLACVEVFAVGGRGPADATDIDYYAVRTVLGKLTSDVARQALEVGSLSAASPIVIVLLGEIVNRFSVVVSERFAATAFPILGAMGGATLNMIFMDHFQRIAFGHFTVRRLERIYGADLIRVPYHQKALLLAAKR